MTNPVAQIQALLEKGLAFHRSGQLQQAHAQYEQVLKLQPRNFDALQLLGMIAAQTKNYRQATEFFGKALEVNATDASLHNNLGFAFNALGNCQAAVASYDRAIALAPGYAKAHNNRGMALAGLGRFDAALAAYDRAIAIDPRYAEAQGNRGHALANLKRPDAAIAAFDRAIALNPNDAQACNNRGNALAELGRFADALGSYDKAIALNPNDADAHNNRGLVLTEMDRFDDAIAGFDRAIAIDPGRADIHCNRGVALSESKRPDAALANFDKAIALQPDYAIALRNKGLGLLALGQYGPGWQLFEWREPEPKTAIDAIWRKPRWTGDQPLRGKSILVHFERGLGDTIQFSRYIALLEREGATVLFAPQKSLMTLMRGLGADVRIVDFDDADISFDYHVPLLSLPATFKNHQAIPVQDAYLAAEPERVARWKTRIGDGDFKIGICWQGEPRKNDRGRSFPLSVFRGLGAIAGIRLVSLHKGAGEAQLADLPAGMTVQTLGDNFDAGPDALLDTAAAMMACDLVVTSDTCIAHLAGALGVPVWVVLKHVPDWRWMLDRPDCPWYPAMRLFRQSSPDDWALVFSDVEDAVRKEMAAR